MDNAKAHILCAFSTKSVSSFSSEEETKTEDGRERSRNESRSTSQGWRLLLFVLR